MSDATSRTQEQAKTCPFCAELVSAAARKCKHCGELIDADLRREVAQAGSWKPGVAALLSFFVPGAGQIYKGQVANGLVWLLLTAAGYAAFVIPGMALHLLCIFGAASGKPKPRIAKA